MRFQRRIAREWTQRLPQQTTMDALIQQLPTQCLDKGQNNDFRSSKYTIKAARPEYIDATLDTLRECLNRLTVYEDDQARNSSIAMYYPSAHVPLLVLEDIQRSVDALKAHNDIFSEIVVACFCGLTVEMKKTRTPPIVTAVHPNSIFAGKVEINDRLVSINGEDCLVSSQNQLNNLLTKHSCSRPGQENCKLVFCSGQKLNKLTGVALVPKPQVPIGQKCAARAMPMTTATTVDKATPRAIVAEAEAASAKPAAIATPRATVAEAEAASAKPAAIATPRATVAEAEAASAKPAAIATPRATVAASQASTNLWTGSYGKHPWVQQNFVKRLKFKDSNNDVHLSKFGAKVRRMKPQEIVAMLCKKNPLPDDLNEKILRDYITRVTYRLRDSFW
eukprot:CAMPEP_0113471052 /NCGR_PEP_ID=MMETSP0014_2-20120614/16777_1 /TAXON_ID=2857 /ORGANISM="Nitzschia sp." /LENGTH=391 /DNA_ID=CAMNT_0000363671 /DNA_START=84 /DNA_END=1256 /DNA_ORIENTATION=+ /assembly_acc=CAM_ASM_000159